MRHKNVTFGDDGAELNGEYVRDLPEGDPQWKLPKNRRGYLLSTPPLTFDPSGYRVQVTFRAEAFPGIDKPCPVFVVGVPGDAWKDVTLDGRWFDIHGMSEEWARSNLPHRRVHLCESLVCESSGDVMVIMSDTCTCRVA